MHVIHTTKRFPENHDQSLSLASVVLNVLSHDILLTYILIHSSVKSFLIFYNRSELEFIPVTPYTVCSYSYRLESWILSTRLFLTRAG